MTESGQFSKGRKCVLCGSKGKPGARGQKPQGNRFWLSLSDKKNDRLLLCKVVNPPTLESIGAKINLEGLEA